MEITLLTIAPITVAIIEVLKRTKGISNLLDGRWEITAIAIAIVIAVLGGLNPIAGFLSGLASQGLYDSASAGLEKMRELRQ